MNVQIKKLAVTFLLVALFTSSLSLGASSFFNRGPGGDDKNQGATSEDDLLSGPAFLQYDPTAYGAGPNGQNLTDAVADIYARDLVAQNPEGPQIQEDGAISLFSPDTSNLAEYLSKNPPSPQLLTPPVDESKIQIVANPTIEDIVHYLSEVSQLQSNVSSDPMWQSTVAATSTSAEWVIQSRDTLGTARDQLYATKVPASFLEFHKSLLALFSTTASFSQTAAQDPVAAVTLAQGLGAVLDRQGNDVEKAQEKILDDLPVLLSQLPQEDRSAAAKLLGIQIARAQTPVTDVAHIATTISQWAKDFALEYKKIALGIAMGYLKNTLIQVLSRKIITWAAGEGVPGFVTNWLVFETDAAIDAAATAIGQRTGVLCGNAETDGLFGDVIASALGAPGQGSGGGPRGGGDPPNCPQLSREQQGFVAGEFQWDNLLGSLKYNVWSQVLDVRDAALGAAYSSAKSSINEAMAGRGQLDSKKCEDGASGGGGDCADPRAARTVSLGSAKQDLVSRALSATIDQISSANNENMLTTLATTVATAVLSAALQKAGGIFTRAVLGSDAGSGSGFGSRPDFIPTAPAPTWEEQIDQYAEILNIALSNTTGAATALTNAINILENSIQACGEDDAPALQALIDGFKALQGPLETRRQNIQRLLGVVAEFQADPRAHTLAELQSRVGTFNAVADIARTAVQDNQRAEGAVMEASNFIQTCTGS